ncbi:uncharacterized protein LOC135686383 isoform X2 [Rhopilema esculentum]|uniref:uncharacterized protein LOC135686383 isoform X2 n=1 Tax=Rhopilema esculentum TaxID=499914 RepID=UPI0031CF5979
MAALLLKEKIQVETNHGPCEIHLNFGSITKLDKKDKVDVLVVSAFPGDYSPTPTSVIGALQRDLKISVRNLSKDKEEDHRRLFSCWWSKPLAKEYSYGRILCFEGSFKKNSRPPMVVGEVFRCLISMCKEKDIKVIMPLLASGDQGYSQQMMLRLIVEAAVHWMKIGLPLKVLKIVVYDRNLGGVDKHPLLSYFRELKVKWDEIMAKENEEPEVHPIEYDVYLSYNNADQQLANVVTESLKETNNSIRIFTKHQTLNQNVSWQEEIYKVMVASARVITILSPRFLDDEACLEQYNIALCCTRNMKRDYLAPFYTDSIDDMPTYMCLIQYVDCRPADYDKISQACKSVTDWLQMHLAEIKHLESETQTLKVAKPSVRNEYDVFISYSHQNSDVAHVIQRHLSLFYPDWNIFIDIAELQTGVAWQVKLFKSIEASRYVITLLAPPYLQSKVCQEEYNLASALHSDPAYSTKLIPILVEPVERLPVWCSNYTPIDCKNMSDRALMEIIQKLHLFEKLDLLEDRRMSSVEQITSDWRIEHTLRGLQFFDGLDTRDVFDFTGSELWRTGQSNSTDIMLCYHDLDASHGEFLAERLQHYLPGVNLSIPEKSKVRHNLLDDATLIVPLMSGCFVKSAELSEELNTALCRQRFSNRLVLFPIGLEPLPLTPAYSRLIWSVVSCNDRIWKNPGLFRPEKDFKVAYAGNKFCLDFSARFIAFILTHPVLFQGSFKTLISTEELLDSTLTFRANRQVDPASNNPLYFDKARAGHMVSEEILTPKKLCHVNSVEEFSSTLKDDDTQKEKTLPNFPQQDSSSIKPSLANSGISCISPAADPPKSPTKLPKQASENEDAPDLSTDESGSTNEDVQKVRKEVPAPLDCRAPLPESELKPDEPKGDERV